MLPVIGLLERVVGVADHAVRPDQAIHPVIDRAGGLEGEDLGRLELVALDQPLHAIDHPGYVTYAGDHLRIREQRRQRRQLGAL